MTTALLLIISLLLILTSGVLGQATCPTGTKSDKLACLIPQVYGVNGIDVNHGTTAGQFTSDFLTTSLNPVVSSIARQSALLPLASPSSGITFTWDAANKLFVSSTDSFGPIFGERAETIGRHRVFLGISYQYFNFTSLDGISLKNMPVVLTQPDDSVTLSSQNLTCSVNAPASSVTESSFGQCGYIRDVINTSNRIDLKIHQFTTFITFGLTNQIDLSLAIPIENVRMNVTSNATLVHNDSPSRFFHGFLPTSTCPAVCVESSSSNPGTAAGIGDMTLRLKGTAWKGERAALALGVDVRVPTGDQLDFLGAGAPGVRPFVDWSYRSRVSPNILVGYEANGTSIIGGDITTGKKDRLPSQLTYSVGADVWLTKWLTGAFDIVGQQVFQGESSGIKSLHDLGQCQDSQALACDPNVALSPPNTYQDLSLSTGSYNMTNASVGIKVKPGSNLIITGNVLIKLNNSGLRAKTIPLVGLSYTF